MSNRIVDPYATGMWFTVWREAKRVDVPPRLELVPRCEPRSWLLREGWLRGGPRISFHEVPGPR